MAASHLFWTKWLIYLHVFNYAVQPDAFNWSTNCVSNAHHSTVMPEKWLHMKSYSGFGWPFVKQFALCYRIIVYPVLYVTLVYCGQTVGWIKMKLGMAVCLSRGHIVLDGDPAPCPRIGAQQGLPFWPKSTVAKLSPITATAEHLYNMVLYRECRLPIKITLTCTF